MISMHGSKSLDFFMEKEPAINVGVEQKSTLWKTKDMDVGGVQPEIVEQNKVIFSNLKKKSLL